MNKMELETHECLQFFLPQIAVALQDIAKELKKQNERKEDKPQNQPSVAIDTRRARLSKKEAIYLLVEAGIPVIQQDNGDVELLNGQLIIGSRYAFLKLKSILPEDLSKFVNPFYEKYPFETTGENPISLNELSESHIIDFINGFKTLTKELSE